MPQPVRAVTPGTASVRPMVAADISRAAEIAAAAFGAEPDPANHAQLCRRLGHCLESDPEGAFVALGHGRIVALAQAIRREEIWVLSMLAVDPAAQSAGAGRALVNAALGYLQPRDGGLIMSSNDPRAIALYGRAGFALQPSFQASGTIDLTAMPRNLAEVTDAAGELDVLAPISRTVRGAAHTRELPLVVARGARILRLGDRGYAVAIPGQLVWMLAARDEDAATALLWHALAAVGASERAVIRWITAPQQWAVTVALGAGLRLAPNGPVCTRGVGAPLHPYLPSAPFG